MRRGKLQRARLPFLHHRKKSRHSYRGEKQLLSNRESEILKRLCDNKDQVLPMKGILIDLWGDDSFFNARSLHVFITKLRHKLSKDESIKILNIRGIGYKLIID